MEYITVEKHIITGHYASDSIPEGAIPVTDFIGRVGEPVSYYNPDWSRKSDIELMLSGLMTIPNGYKINEEKTALQEMTEDEKIIAGIKDLPQGQKIEDGKILPMTDEEKLSAGQLTQEEYDRIQYGKLIARLKKIDEESIRSIRALLANNYTADDQKTLENHEKEIVQIRGELKKFKLF